MKVSRSRVLNPLISSHILLCLVPAGHVSGAPCSNLVIMTHCMKTNVHADQEDISSLINWKLIVCTDHPGSTDLNGPTVRARARARARG